MLTLFPAAFMTSVTTTYIFTAKIGFNLSDACIPYLGVGIFAVSVLLFYVARHNRLKKQ